MKTAVLVLCLLALPTLAIAHGYITGEELQTFPGTYTQ